MTKAHEATAIIVVLFLLLSILILVNYLNKKDNEIAKTYKLEEFVKMECHLLGNASSDSYYYTPVYFCKHEERNTCFYVVRVNGGVTMTIAPCFGEN